MASIDRPLSIREISSRAVDFPFSNRIPFEHWLRIAKLLIREATLCEQDGNISMAYMYLIRHGELVLQKLPQHPDFRKPEHRHDLALAHQAVRENIDNLDQWKVLITQNYENYRRALERRQQEQARRDSRTPSKSNGRRIEQPEDTGYDFSIDLAPSPESSKRSSSDDDIRPDLSKKSKTESDRLSSNQKTHHLQDLGKLLYAKHQAQTRGSQSARKASIPYSPAYHYPAVPKKAEPNDFKPSLVRGKSNAVSSEGLPLVPPKEPDHSAPARPPKISLPPMAPKPEELAKYTIKAKASTEGGAPLRPVLLPPDLRTTFLNLAQRNTRRDLETCGILCGTIVSNALFISHLVIPDQTSTSDTCDTTADGDRTLFEYCDGNNLLVCGWIHTHPSQSCFLSSRDLHTSSGYQVMMPEAIAIVCAPQHKPDWGIFRLTDPYGLPNILNCTKPGLFHLHDEKDLYTSAFKPGHVIEAPGWKFELVDLRHDRH
ncbi:hypothetical protein K470DRAFT_275526 [Piedraia hortae CBS 480.64]|uniref:MPN domain-containing protein n=1 Tax=Piedraia hortae CBS 480.64 TaxID=1314780 RepID=A0A6A7C480_9PEZI|nr:hypothetical protein K470DRAFT_275526 [Piedraia hortae CBS 480.64]